ncbi:MAG: DUF1553 domain-containing protein [Planctomycetaceae bacterium]
MRKSQRRSKTSKTNFSKSISKFNSRGGPELEALNGQITELKSSFPQKQTSAFGYHSQIATKAEQSKWVQLDLGAVVPVRRIVLVGAYDDYNNIGAGFGFPLRYRIEAADDPEFKENVQTIVDKTEYDQLNPGVEPQLVDANLSARYIRITATRLAERSNDFILALGEIQCFGEELNPIAVTEVSSKDSIESGDRWGRGNLIDGRFYGAPEQVEDFHRYLTLLHERDVLLKTNLPPEAQERIVTAQQKLNDKKTAYAHLPAKQKVYCGMVYTGSGSFTGTGNNQGKPRDIHVLDRGDVEKKLQPVLPGTLPVIADVDSRFDLPEDHSESERRVALANWIVRDDNPLTWRSIVNRIWLFHFGRGIVDSPNDFGRMGQLPTHPELLNWLAIQFRDGNQSLKELHRLILSSATYRQSSDHQEVAALIDSENQYYWRMNRQRLDAEAIRDSVLLLSGNLNPQLYGPSFQDFVIQNPEHSPHYEYDLYDPTNPESFRRSVYRFLVRSQPQPFMETLDCADPSERVAKRAETLTVLQALALLNNGFMLHMAESLANEIEATTTNPDQQIELLFQRVLQRNPHEDERTLFKQYLSQHGLKNCARLIFNLNEFVFLD